MSYTDEEHKIYDAGFLDGYISKGRSGAQDYQQGQVLMRNKCLQVIKKYYGSSVYDYLKEKIDAITLEE